MFKYIILILTLKSISNYTSTDIFNYYTFNPNILYEHRNSQVLLNKVSVYRVESTHFDFAISYEANGPGFSESDQFLVYVIISLIF
jgi:hypothetical protein